MSDLDFDELDKAVSTLMGDVPKVEPVKTDDVKTLSIASTLPDESRPSLAKLDSELSKVNNAPSSIASKPATEPVVSAPSLAARRGGRFMDVVHPSSDMKGVTKPVTSMSRQGVTIEPVSSFPRADEKPENVMDVVKSIDTPVMDHNESVPDAQTESRSEREIPKNDWPDPLDMSSYAKEPDTNGAEDTASADVSIAPEKDEEMQPLVSPFLPDAKVEKRPLGGAPAEEIKENDDVQEEELGRAPAVGAVSADDEAVEDAAEQLPADPITIEQPLPPELQSDLMAIETDGGTTAAADKVPEEVKAPVVEKTPDAILSPAQDKKPLGESIAAASGSTGAALAGPTSIPQQYQEEPTTSDQTNGAIYDTDSYHQPLAHPVKAKSGWLWIIWILLLLMVGGGGAVALYFLGII